MKKNILFIISGIASVLVTGILPSLIQTLIPVDYSVFAIILCIFLSIILGLIYYIFIKYNSQKEEVDLEKQITEKTQLQEELEKSNKSNKEIESINSKLIQENKNLQESITTLTRENKTLEAIKNRLHRNLKENENSNNRLTKANKQLQDSINDLNEENKAALEIIEELKNEIIQHTSNSYAATGIVFNEDYSKVLLTYHDKHRRWLPPGSHINGVQYLHEIVIDSAKRETGYSSIKFHESHNYEEYQDDNCYLVPCPFSVQVETQMANEGHDHHYDALYILTANESEKISHPGTHTIQWFSVKDLENIAQRGNTYPDVIRSVQEALNIISQPKGVNKIEE